MVGARHLGAFHEHRHHPDTAGERRSGFEAYEIGGIVEPAPTFAVGSEPVLADENDQDFTRDKRAFDGLDEIDAGLDPLHVHEYAIGAEVGGEPIVESAGIAGSVVTPVAYEYAVHRLGQGHREK